MINVFIVDDENIIREGLNDLIPWNSLGLTVSGTASNGEEALEQIKAKVPDIVLTDIKMPKMDGLKLSSALKTIFPKIKIIILTGYEDFDYAHQAIQLSVKDYVLKPVDSAKLIECIKNVRDLVIKEKSEQLEKEAIKSHIKDSLPYMKNWFFNALESNGVEEEYIWQKLGFLGVDINQSFFQVVNLTVDKLDSTLEEENQFTLYKLYQGVKYLLGNIGIKSILFNENDLMTIILSFSEAFDTKQVLNKSFGVAQMLKEHIEFNYRLSYTIGLGDVVSKISDVINSYQSAVDACKHKFYLGSNQIIYIQDVEPIKEKRAFKLSVQEKFMTAVKVGDVNEVNNTIRKLFNDLSTEREDIVTVRMVCLELITHALRAIYEVGGKPEILLSEPNLWVEINSILTIDQLYSFVISKISILLDNLISKRKSKNEKIVEAVKNIIEQEYNKNISLDSVSDMVHLSSCYLSSLFSQEFGITFKDYLINTRISKAKEFLANPDTKVYEVAEKVGYQDPHYFSQIFKKLTGLTPAQYRNIQLD